MITTFRLVHFGPLRNGGRHVLGEHRRPTLEAAGQLAAELVRGTDTLVDVWEEIHLEDGRLHEAHRRGARTWRQKKDRTVA